MADQRGAEQIIARLRARTHEIQAEESTRRAELQSQADTHRATMERAREAVAGFRADWTSDPRAQEKGGLWSYASMNTRAAMTLLVEQTEAAEAALREALDREGRAVANMGERAQRAEDENARLRAALPDPARLNLLADWLDARECDGRAPHGGRSPRQGTEVQDDLRRWAASAWDLARTPGGEDG